VPELLPVHQLTLTSRMGRLTVKDTEIHFSSGPIGMFIPNNFLVVGFLCANTDDCINISTFSCWGMHVKVSRFEGDGMLDLKFVFQVMRSNIEWLEDLYVSRNNWQEERRTMATSKSTSCQANGRPIHPLTPFPNGFQLSGGRFLNPPLSIRSGLPVSYISLVKVIDIPELMSIISPDFGIGV